MSERRPVFQLYAEGASINGWPFKMRSKIVFISREKAEEYVPTFEALCFDKKYFEYADRSEPLKIHIRELELEE